MTSQGYSAQLVNALLHRPLLVTSWRVHGRGSDGHELCSMGYLLCPRHAEALMRESARAIWLELPLRVWTGGWFMRPSRPSREFQQS
jgi:hypothetical protein